MSLLRFCSPKRKRNNKNKIFPKVPSFLRFGKKKSKYHSDDEDDVSYGTRDEIAKIQEEQTKAADLQSEKEEEMYRLHEVHKMEVEAEKEKLRQRIEKFEREKAEAELEIEEKRRQLQEDSISGNERLAEEREKLREKERQHWENINKATQEFPIQTMSDLGSLALRTESQMSYAASGESQQKLEEWRKQLEEKEKNLQKTKEQTEEELLKKQQEIEEMFLVESDKLELEKRRLKQKESEYHKQNAAMHTSVAAQTDHIELLEHRKMQLYQYIDAKEFEMEYEREPPVGASYSDDSMKGSLRSPRQQTRAISDPGNERPLYNKRSARSVSMGTSPMSSTEKDIAPKAGTKPKVKNSSRAQQVTNRLYNPEKIKQRVTASGLKQQDGSGFTVTKSRSTPVLGKNKPPLPPVKRPGVKKKLLQHSTSAASLASVPETADEMEEEQINQSTESLHIEAYSEEPVRLRSKKDKQRPHSWAAPQDNTQRYSMMFTPALNESVPEYSSETIADLDMSGENYNDLDTISSAPNNNNKLSCRDSILDDPNNFYEELIDPFKEPRQSPDGKERSDSIASCRSSVIPAHIPTVRAEVVNQISAKQIPHSQDITYPFIIDSSSSIKDKSASDTFHDYNNPLVSGLMDKDQQHQQVKSGSVLVSPLHENLGTVSKSNSEASSSPPKKKRPKSANTQELNTRLQELSRPRSASTRSASGHNDEQSPLLPRKQRANSDKIGVRKFSTGTPSPKSSPKLKHKSSSPQSSSKKSKKSKAGDSSMDVLVSSNRSKPKRPFENDDVKESDINNSAHEAKKHKTGKSSSSQGDQYTVKGSDDFQTVLSSEMINNRQQGFLDSHEGVDKIDEENGVFVNLLSSQGEQKIDDKLSICDDKLSTGGDKLSTGDDKLSTGDNKLSTHEKELFLSDRAKNQTDFLQREEHGAYSADSLDDNEDLNDLTDASTLADKKQEKSKRNKEPAKKKAKLDTTASNVADSCQPPLSSLGTSNQTLPGSISDGNYTKTDSQQTHIVHPCHDEGLENPSLHSVPSISVQSAIISSAPLTIPYYFRTGGSRSDSDLLSNRNANPDLELWRQRLTAVENKRPKSASNSRGAKMESSDSPLEYLTMSLNRDYKDVPNTTAASYKIDTPTRKTTKHRHQRRRAQEDVPTESESGQLTDDSYPSGMKKPSSRPSPNTKRRKVKRHVTAGKKSLLMSSEEYASSDNDSNFSEDSLHSEERYYEADSVTSSQTQNKAISDAESTPRQVYGETSNSSQIEVESSDFENKDSVHEIHEESTPSQIDGASSNGSHVGVESPVTDNTDSVHLHEIQDSESPVNTVYQEGLDNLTDVFVRNSKETSGDSTAVNQNDNVTLLDQEAIPDVKLEKETKQFKESIGINNEEREVLPTGSSTKINTKDSVASINTDRETNINTDNEISPIGIEVQGHEILPSEESINFENDTVSSKSNNVSISSMESKSSSTDLTDITGSSSSSLLDIESEQTITNEITDDESIFVTGSNNELGNVVDSVSVSIDKSGHDQNDTSKSLVQRSKDHDQNDPSKSLVERSKAHDQNDPSKSSGKGSKDGNNGDNNETENGIHETVEMEAALHVLGSEQTIGEPTSQEVKTTNTRNVKDDDIESMESENEYLDSMEQPPIKDSDNESTDAEFLDSLQDDNIPEKVSTEITHKDESAIKSNYFTRLKGLGYTKVDCWDNYNDLSKQSESFSLVVDLSSCISSASTLSPINNVSLPGQSHNQVSSIAGDLAMHLGSSVGRQDNHSKQQSGPPTKELKVAKLQHLDIIDGDTNQDNETSRPPVDVGQAAMGDLDHSYEILSRIPENEHNIPDDTLGPRVEVTREDIFRSSNSSLNSNLNESKEDLPGHLLEKDSGFEANQLKPNAVTKGHASDVSIETDSLCRDSVATGDFTMDTDSIGCVSEMDSHEPSPERSGPLLLERETSKDSLNVMHDNKEGFSDDKENITSKGDKTFEHGSTYYTENITVGSDKSTNDLSTDNRENITLGTEKTIEQGSAYDIENAIVVDAGKTSKQGPTDHRDNTTFDGAETMSYLSTEYKNTMLGSDKSIDQEPLAKRDRKVSFNEDPQMISDKSLTSSSTSSLGDKLCSENMDGLISPSDIIVGNLHEFEESNIPTTGTTDLKVDISSSSEKPKEQPDSISNRDSGYYGVSISASESESEDHSGHTNFHSSSGVSSGLEQSNGSLSVSSPLNQSLAVSQDHGIEADITTQEYVDKTEPGSYQELTKKQEMEKQLNVRSDVNDGNVISLADDHVIKTEQNNEKAQNGDVHRKEETVVTGGENGNLTAVDISNGENENITGDISNVTSTDVQDKININKETVDPIRIEEQEIEQHDDMKSTETEIKGQDDMKSNQTEMKGQNVDTKSIETEMKGQDGMKSNDIEMKDQVDMGSNQSKMKGQDDMKSNDTDMKGQDDMKSNEIEMKDQVDMGSNQSKMKGQDDMKSNDTDMEGQDDMKSNETDMKGQNDMKSNETEMKGQNNMKSNEAEMKSQDGMKSNEMKCQIAMKSNETEMKEEGDMEPNVTETEDQSNLESLDSGDHLHSKPEKEEFNEQSTSTKTEFPIESKSLDSGTSMQHSQPMQDLDSSVNEQSTVSHPEDLNASQSNEVPMKSTNIDSDGAIHSHSDQQETSVFEPSTVTQSEDLNNSKSNELPMKSTTDDFDSAIDSHYDQQETSILEQSTVSQSDDLNASQSNEVPMTSTTDDSENPIHSQEKSSEQSTDNQPTDLNASEDHDLSLQTQSVDLDMPMHSQQKQKESEKTLDNSFNTKGKDNETRGKLDQVDNNIDNFNEDKTKSISAEEIVGDSSAESRNQDPIQSQTDQKEESSELTDTRTDNTVEDSVNTDFKDDHANTDHKKLNQVDHNADNIVNDETNKIDNKTLSDSLEESKNQDNVSKAEENIPVKNESHTDDNSQSMKSQSEESEGTIPEQTIGKGEEQNNLLDSNEAVKLSTENNSGDWIASQQTTEVPMESISVDYDSDLNSQTEQEGSDSIQKSEPSDSSDRTLSKEENSVNIDTKDNGNDVQRKLHKKEDSNGTIDESKLAETDLEVIEETQSEESRNKDNSDVIERSEDNSVISKPPESPTDISVESLKPESKELPKDSVTLEQKLKYQSEKLDREKDSHLDDVLKMSQQCTEEPMDPSQLNSHAELQKVSNAIIKTDQSNGKDSGKKVKVVDANDNDNNKSRKKVDKVDFTSDDMNKDRVNAAEEIIGDTIGESISLERQEAKSHYDDIEANENEKLAPDSDLQQTDDINRLQNTEVPMESKSVDSESSVHSLPNQQKQGVIQKNEQSKDTNFDKIKENEKTSGDIDTKDTKDNGSVAGIRKLDQVDYTSGNVVEDKTSSDDGIMSDELGDSSEELVQDDDIQKIGEQNESNSVAVNQFQTRPIDGSVHSVKSNSEELSDTLSGKFLKIGEQEEKDSMKVEKSNTESNVFPAEELNESQIHIKMPLESTNLNSETPVDSQSKSEKSGVLEKSTGSHSESINGSQINEVPIESKSHETVEVPKESEQTNDAKTGDLNGSQTNEIPIESTPLDLESHLHSQTGHEESSTLKPTDETKTENLNGSQTNEMNNESTTPDSDGHLHSQTDHEESSSTHETKTENLNGSHSNEIPIESTTPEQEEKSNVMQKNESSSDTQSDKISVKEDDKTSVKEDDQTSVKVDDETSVKVDDETSVKVDDETSVKEDNKTSVKVDDETSVKVDDETSVKVDDKTSVKVDDETSVKVDDETSVNVDNETSVKEDDKTSVKVDDETSVKVDDETSVNVDDETSVKEDDKTSVKVDDKISIKEDDETSVKEDDKTSVKVDDETSVKVDDETSVKVDDKTSVKVDDETSVKEHDKTSVKVDDKISIKEDDETSVKEDDKTSVKVDDETSVKVDDKTSVKVDDETSVKVDDETSVKEDDKTSVKEDDNMNLDANNERKLDHVASSCTGSVDENKNYTDGENVDEIVGKDSVIKVKENSEIVPNIVQTEHDELTKLDNITDNKDKEESTVNKQLQYKETKLKSEICDRTLKTSITENTDNDKDNKNIQESIIAENPGLSTLTECNIAKDHDMRENQYTSPINRSEQTYDQSMTDNKELTSGIDLNTEQHERLEGAPGNVKEIQDSAIKEIRNDNNKVEGLPTNTDKNLFENSTERSTLIESPYGNNIGSIQDPVCIESIANNNYTDNNSKLELENNLERGQIQQGSIPQEECEIDLNKNTSNIQKEDKNTLNKTDIENNTELDIDVENNVDKVVNKPIKEVSGSTSLKYNSIDSTVLDISELGSSDKGDHLIISDNPSLEEVQSEESTFKDSSVLVCGSKDISNERDSVESIASINQNQSTTNVSESPQLQVSDTSVSISEQETEGIQPGNVQECDQKTQSIKTENVEKNIDSHDKSQSKSDENLIATQEVNSTTLLENRAYQETGNTLPLIGNEIEDKCVLEVDSDHYQESVRQQEFTCSNENDNTLNRNSNVHNKLEENLQISCVNTQTKTNEKQGSLVEITETENLDNDNGKINKESILQKESGDYVQSEGHDKFESQLGSEKCDDIENLHVTGEKKLGLNGDHVDNKVIGDIKNIDSCSDDDDDKYEKDTLDSVDSLDTDVKDLPLTDEKRNVKIQESQELNINMESDVNGNTEQENIPGSKDLNQAGDNAMGCITEDQVVPGDNTNDIQLNGDLNLNTGYEQSNDHQVVPGDQRNNIEDDHTFGNTAQNNQSQNDVGVHGAVGGGLHSPNIHPRSDHYTDGVLPMSADTSFDEGYTTMMGSPRSESIDDFNARNISAPHDRHLDLQPLPVTSSPRVPPLDLSALSGQSEDSTPRMSGGERHARQRSSERGELQGDSRFVEVMDSTEPREDRSDVESTRFMAVLDNSQSSIPDIDMDTSFPTENNLQEDGNDGYSPVLSPGDKVLSESDITQGELTGNLQQKNNRSSGNLSKSDLHLQPSKDEDMELFENKDGSGSSTQTAGETDTGSYELVHYKAPEPRRKKKKANVDDNKKKQAAKEKLSQSDTSTLTNDDISDLEEKLLKEGTAYTTVKESDTREDLQKLQESVEGNNIHKPMTKQLSLMVQVDDNDQTEELNEQDIEYIHEQKKEPPKKPLRKNLSMVVETGIDPIEDISEEEIERLQHQTAASEDKPEELTNIPVEPENAVPPDADVKGLKKNLSLVVMPDVDRTENELTEEDVEILRNRFSIQDMDNMNVIDELGGINQQQNELDRLPVESKPAQRQYSVAANIDENESQDEITEDDIVWDNKISKNEDDVSSKDPDQSRQIQTKPAKLRTQGSMVVNIDENEQPDTITEEEINLSRTLNMGETMEEENIAGEEGSNDNNVKFSIGDNEDEMESESAVPGDEMEIESPVPATSEEMLNKLIEKMNQERQEVQGVEQTRISNSVPSAEELKRQLSKHESKSKEKNPQSDSAFSSDYTDHTQSDYTDSEMFSPKVARKQDVHRQEIVVGAVQGAIVEEPGDMKNSRIDSTDAFNDSGSLDHAKQIYNRGRSDSDVEDDNTKFVSIGENGKADSIEEIQQIPSPRNDVVSKDKKGKTVTFRDTNVIGFDVRPDLSRPRSPDSSPLDGPDLIMGSRQSVSYASDRSKTRIYSDIEIMGLQPGGSTAPQYTPGPEQVLREDNVPNYAVENNLITTALNIEINPVRRTPLDEDMLAIGGPETENNGENMLAIENNINKNDENVDSNINGKQYNNGDVVIKVEERPQSAGAKERTQHVATKSKSEPGMGKSTNNNDDHIENDLQRKITSTVKTGLTDEQRKIGQITKSERELLGSREDLFEELIESFPDITDTVEISAASRKVTKDDSGIPRKKARSMDAALSSVSSVDAHVSIVEDTDDENTDEENSAEKEAKMKMFKEAGQLRFDNDGKTVDGDNDKSLLSDRSESEISDVILVESVASGNSSMELDEKQTVVSASDSDLSPGELRIPPSIDTLDSLSSDLWGDSTENFNYIKWVEEVSDLPEKIGDHVDELRENWMRRFHNWNMSSLSTSELEYCEPRDMYEGMSLSLDCVQLSNPTFHKDAFPKDDVSSDSITYVFVDRAQSLDAVVDQEEDSRASRMTTSTSEPSCTEKEMRHKYGIDETVLPFKEISQSAEALSDGISQEAMSARQRSQSIDNSKLLNSGEQRPDSPEITPENVFGGVGNDDQETVVSAKPPLPDHEYVRPIPGDEPVRLRRRRGKEINKRVSWGDVEEKLAYAATSSGENSRESSQPREEKCNVAIQTSESLEELKRQGARILIIKDTETQTSEDNVSTTDADTVLSNARRDETGSLMSMSSQLTDAQTSPIPLDRDTSSTELGTGPNRKQQSPDHADSESSLLIKQALNNLRNAMGSQTEISIVDADDIPPGKPVKVSHYNTHITKTADEMVYPPSEGPLHISSPTENEQHRLQKQQERNPVSKLKAARELIMDVESDFTTIDDSNINGYHIHQGNARLILRPPTDQVTTNDINISKPPQPVGTAKPMRGHPAMLTTQEGNDTNNLPDELPQFVDYPPQAYLGYQHTIPRLTHEYPRLPSEYPRTIETQTWPDVRVIETQTYSEHRIIETQTSPLFMNDTDSTQTEVIDTNPIGVQTDNNEIAFQRGLLDTVDTGCNPSPPRGFSPIEFAVQTDSNRVLPLFDDVFCQTDDFLTPQESYNIQNAVNLEPQILRSVFTESIGIQAGSPKTGSYENVSDLSSSSSKKEEGRSENGNERKSRDIKIQDVDILPVPQYQFNQGNLSYLAAEHEKLLKLFSKSKTDREESIKNRQQLREKRRGEVMTEMEKMSESLNSSFALDDLQSPNISTASREDIQISAQLNSGIVDIDTERRNEMNVNIEYNTDVIKVEGQNCDINANSSILHSDRRLQSNSVVQTGQTNVSTDISNTNRESTSVSQTDRNLENALLNEVNKENQVQTTSEILPGLSKTADFKEDGQETESEETGQSSQLKNKTKVTTALKTLKSLVMSDEYRFNIQEGSNPDITDLSNAEGFSEDLKGGAVDIIATGAVENNEDDDDDTDEFLLLPENLQNSDGVIGNGLIQYEKIVDTSYDEGDEVGNAQLTAAEMNVSIASSTAAEIQEIMKQTEVNVTRTSEDVTTGLGSVKVNAQVSESASTVLNQANLSSDLAVNEQQGQVNEIAERPSSCVASTQYEETDFISALNVQTNAGSEDLQLSSLEVASTLTATTTRASDSDIRSKYETIKKIVESDDLPQKTSSQKSSSGGTHNEELKAVERKRNNSTGSSLKKDNTLDESFDISLSESFTGSEMKDESIETDHYDYSEELEMLRKERQRILDMLAKDMMPSKLQVELAEAQLNYIIGQTDTLLHTIDEPWDWDLQSISHYTQYPEEQLSEISKEHLTKYRHSLEMSKMHIDTRIKELEREKEKKHRARERSKKFARLRREAAREVFVIERMRENNTYDRVIKPMKSRSQSDSPLRRSASDPKKKPESPFNSNTVLTPKQRQQHLTNLRRGIVKYTDEERSRSISPALSSASSSAPMSRSRGSTHQHTRYGAGHLHYSPYRSTYLEQYGPQAINSPRSGSLESPRGASGVSYSGIGLAPPGGYSLYGDSDTMSIGSLDEDTQRLLGDVQQVRGQTSQEIEKAKKYLEKKSPVTSPAPRSSSYTSYSATSIPSYLHYTPHDMYGIVTAAQLATDIDRRAEHRINTIEKTSNQKGHKPPAYSTSTTTRPATDKQIDQEIEELKKKYGMMARSTTTPTPSHTATALDRYTRSPSSSLTSRPGLSAYSGTSSPLLSSTPNRLASSSTTNRLASSSTSRLYTQSVTLTSSNTTTSAFRTTRPDYSKLGQK